jgi:hypothetical protein
MTTPVQRLLADQKKALALPNPGQACDAHMAIKLAAIAEGFCPMCGYQLTPGRCCLNPRFCGIEGGYMMWTADGIAITGRRH